MTAKAHSLYGPLPQPDPVSQLYWDSVRAHAMRLQRCVDCEKWVFYPRAACPHCGGVSLEWRPVSGRGLVYSFTIVHRAPSPALQEQAPYIVALVELEEGVRLMGRLVGVPVEPGHVRMGAEIVLEYADVTGEVTLPRFRTVHTED